MLSLPLNIQLSKTFNYLSVKNNRNIEDNQKKNKNHKIATNLFCVHWQYQKSTNYRHIESKHIRRSSNFKLSLNRWQFQCFCTSKRKVSLKTMCNLASLIFKFALVFILKKAPKIYFNRHSVEQSVSHVNHISAYQKGPPLLVSV